MNVKEFIKSQIMSSKSSLLHAARRVPADKLDWQPLDSGRFVLDQVQECSNSPLWSVGLLNNRGFNPKLAAEGMKGLEEAKTRLKTLDDCEAEFDKNFKVLAEALDAFPDEELMNTVELPWGNNKIWSFLEIAMIPYWNNAYHMGQICYIQTLYGDKEM